MNKLLISVLALVCLSIGFNFFLFLKLDNPKDSNHLSKIENDLNAMENKLNQVIETLNKTSQGNNSLEPISQARKIDLSELPSPQFENYSEFVTYFKAENKENNFKKRLDWLRKTLKVQEKDLGEDFNRAFERNFDQASKNIMKLGGKVTFINRFDLEAAIVTYFSRETLLVESLLQKVPFAYLEAVRKQNQANHVTLKSQLDKDFIKKGKEESKLPPGAPQR